MLGQISSGANPFLSVLMMLILFGLLVLSISVHEFSHALVSNRLGDPTAKALGRLTLNPMAHLDPMGTIMLLLGGFGWGKPVPFNPMYLSNPIKDSALISLAGPASNILLAVILGLIHKILPVDVLPAMLFGLVLYIGVYINLSLCFFNLIPLHPLDGFKIVGAFIPRGLYLQWMDLAPYGIYILLLIIISGASTILISTPVSFLANILL